MWYSRCYHHANKYLFLVIQLGEVLLNFFGECIANISYHEFTWTKCSSIHEFAITGSGCTISIYSRLSHMYVYMYVCLYTHAYIRMHRYMHMHTYTCSVSWEIFVWFINSIHVLDYPIFFYVLWRSLCLYHVYFKRWYVLCIHKPRLKHDVLPYISMCVYVYVNFSSHDVSLCFYGVG